MDKKFFIMNTVVILIILGLILLAAFIDKSFF